MQAYLREHQPPTLTAWGPHDGYMPEAAARACRGLPDSTMGGAWGHGLGLSFEPPWIHADSEQTAEPDMCLAVEPRIEAPGLGGAQYEDDFLVVEGGAELLTPAEGCYFAGEG
jgi:Xaa-Pro aminopeptidase